MKAKIINNHQLKMFHYHFVGKFSIINIQEINMSKIVQGLKLVAAHHPFLHSGSRWYGKPLADAIYKRVADIHPEIYPFERHIRAFIYVLVGDYISAAHEGSYLISDNPNIRKLIQDSAKLATLVGTVVVRTIIAVVLVSLFSIAHAKRLQKREKRMQQMTEEERQKQEEEERRMKEEEERKKDEELRHRYKETPPTEYYPEHAKERISARPGKKGKSYW